MIEAIRVIGSIDLAGVCCARASLIDSIVCFWKRGSSGCELILARARSMP
jgi:hypothetical protein